MVTKMKCLVVASSIIVAIASPVVVSNVGNPFKQLLDLSSSNSSRNMSEATAEMETTIETLMLDGSFAASPKGGSVNQIHKIITDDLGPKVISAHKSDQRELKKFAAEIKKCSSLKSSALKSADIYLSKYKSQSKLHKRCRADEAAKRTSLTSCVASEKSLHQIKKLKCNAFASRSKKYGTSKNNAIIVRKAGSENVLSYVTRLSTTFCGNHVHGKKGTRSRPGGWGGGLENGMLDKYLKAKDACEVASKNYKDKVKECAAKTRAYKTNKAKCDQYQTLMDSASCKNAVMIKDACEAYAGCYFSRVENFKNLRRKVRYEVRDRKAEWRGLKRIGCLTIAMGKAKGKVTNKDIDTCKKKTHSTKFLDIKYPKIPPPQKCVIPNLYPSTGAYKRAEFAPLPAMAKGMPSPECSGVKAIATKPRKGSPSSCKCRRLAINGAYSSGALVKCTRCLDVSKSLQKNSCPRGTKIFSPASRNDWRTFLVSSLPLRDPHWIVDVTRPQNGCGGCAASPMNSGNKQQRTWRTSDGTPWWLRSSRYNEPNGDYNANCFLDLWNRPPNENGITFNDHRCRYHSKSYYCQAKDVSAKPGPGSPKSCKCTTVDLTGSYSARTLVRCEQCLTVSRATQKNSCPAGMKIFSPRSRADWKTFLNSAKPLRAPNWIIDVTRPQNGCGGCTKYAMASSTRQQASWRTLDGSPWWLRSTTYNEPNGDYTAGCFLDLWKTPISENNIQFNDGRCNYRSRSYYCQPKKAGKKKQKAAPPPPPRMRRTEAQARAYCYSMKGWRVTWRSSKSIICTAPKISSGKNCNTCSDWRLVVFRDGGTDMAPGKGKWGTKAGYYYCGHKPCKAGFNTPVGGRWNLVGSMVYVWQKSKYPQNARPDKFCPAGSTYFSHVCGKGAEKWKEGELSKRVQWGPYTGDQELKAGAHCWKECNCNAIKIACVTGMKFVDVPKKSPQNSYVSKFCPPGTDYVKHVCGKGADSWTGKGSQKVAQGPFTNNPYLGGGSGHCSGSCDCNKVRVQCVDPRKR